MTQFSFYKMTKNQGFSAMLQISSDSLNKPHREKYSNLNVNEVMLATAITFSEVLWWLHLDIQV